MTKVMLGILLLAGSAPLAWAAEPQGQDRAFLDKALHDGLAEVELGKLAARQADSDAVKQFGQRMMEDHQQANQTLMDLARQQGSKEASADRDMPKLEPADETTLAHWAVPALGPGMLCLADRPFFGHALWQEAAATGADLLWRVKRNLRLPRETVLADGSFLTTVYYYGVTNLRT